MRTENSYLYKRGVAPETRTTVSSRIKIYSSPYGLSGFHQIAVVSTMSVNDTRGEQIIRGIGFGDQIAEIVPDVAAAVTLSFTRTAINTSKIAQVFGYKGGVDGLVRAVKHHKWPFDVRQDEVISELERRVAQATTDKEVIITRWVGCWMTSSTYDVNAEGTAVAESADVVVTDILAEEAIANYREGEDFGNDITRDQTGSIVLTQNADGGF